MITERLQKLQIFLAIFLFGASLPFFVSGYMHHKNEYEIVFLNLKPPLLNDANVYNDKKSLNICADSGNRPTYAKMVLDLQAKNENNVRFLNGQSGIWANIVLLTGICVAQWCSGAFVYYLKNDFGKAMNTIQLNVFLALLCFFIILFPVLGNIFYYLLPIPVLIAWIIYGITYSPMYCLWHYVGLLLIFNIPFGADSIVPWLI